jgi:formyltetrahydrofolate synthetase
VVCEHWEKGGAGAVALAQSVKRACNEKTNFQFLYDINLPIKAKIEAIATKIYRADGVDYLPKAEAAIEKYTKLGFGMLPICMAKTQYSFSHDASLKGAPTGFRLPIRCGSHRFSGPFIPLMSVFALKVQRWKQTELGGVATGASVRRCHCLATTDSSPAWPWC